MAQQHPPPQKIQVADGIFLFQTPRYGDMGVDGNSIVIVSAEGVLVFDANGTPAAAENVIAEIRKITPQPVRYLVLSHWHWDHWFGAEAYRKAFPDIHIITTEKTRQMMMGPALQSFRPFLDGDLPAHIADLEKRVAQAEAAHPAPESLPLLRQVLEEDRFFSAQKKAAHPTFADVTFGGQLTLYVGAREIQILNYGYAVTPGDTFLFLPNEKIIVSGDLLVNPISYALNVYPSGWIAALERMDKLDASIILPGHGDPLHDRELLHATLDVFRELQRQGKQCKERGLDADQAKAEILPTLTSLRDKITGKDPAMERRFDLFIVDWFLHRVYDELNGPMTDEIKPAPKS